MDEHLKRIPENQFEKIAALIIKQISLDGIWPRWMEFHVATRYCCCSNAHLISLVEEGCISSKSIWIPGKIKPRRLIDRLSLDRYIESSPKTVFGRSKHENPSPSTRSATNADAKPLVSAETVASRLGCSTAHILKLARSKEIPSYRIGVGCIRFDLEVVLEVLGIIRKIERGATPKCGG